MSILFIVLWISLLYFTSKIKGYFLFFFVLFQFVFVGFGLIVFPLLGFDYLQNTFMSFNFISISTADFNVASAIVLSGVWSTVCTYVLMISLIFRKFDLRRSIVSPAVSIPERSSVRKYFVFIMLPISLIVSIPFILDNYQGFYYIINATNQSDISGAIEYRRGATSGYLKTLYVYNVLPAVTIVSLLLFLERKDKSLFVLFLLLFVITSTSLLLTYQKRPILVFLGALALSNYLYHLLKSAGWSRNEKKIDLFNLAVRLKWAIVVLITLLFLLYFYTTGFRFSAQPFDHLATYANIMFSRIVGRLSIPATMYVDFFPDGHSFYGLSNVGLFGAIFNYDTFSDSHVVFSAYSLKPINGSVAASVFVDAYGQGGFLFPALYGVFLGFIIVVFEVFYVRSRSGSSKIFMAVSVLIFLYYLSQASIFRSLLGYGGVFYFLTWASGFRNKIMLSK